MDPKEMLRAVLGEQLERRALGPALPATYDEQTHSISCVATTEHPVQVLDWDRYEIIDEVILSDGLEFPASGQVPMLDSHMRFSVDNMLGSARDWKPGSPETTCRLYFSSTAQKAETLVREGHLTDVSIGYRPVESVWIPEGQRQTIRGREFQGPKKICLRTRVKEISPTPIGADENAKMRELPEELTQYLSARGLPPGATLEQALEMLKRELSPSTTNPQRKESPLMTPEEKAAQEKAEAELRASQERALAEAREKAEKEAAERVNNIIVTADKFRTAVKDMDALKTQALSERWSSERFYQEVLSRISASPAANPPKDPAPAPAVSLREIDKPWQKRAVALLRMKTFEARQSYDAAQQAAREFAARYGEMTDRQREAEDAEAIEIITKSGLPLAQQKRTMASIAPSTGAYLMPTPMLAEIFVLVEQWAAARRYFRPVQMASETLALKSLVTKAVAYWVAQGSNITLSDLVFGTGDLSTYKLAGISAWTTEFDESTALAYLPIFIESLAEAISEKEDLAGFRGDGTVTYGYFTGVLNVSTNIVTMDNGKAAFGDADADDFRLLRDAVPIRHRTGAMYMLAPGIVSQLEGLKDQQGRYIYREPAAGLPAMLWGYPIMDSVGIDALTQNSAAATKFAAFGNPKNMLMGIKREQELLVSREGILQAANGDIAFNALQADGSIVRVTERVGFKQVLTTTIAVLKTAAQ